MPFLRNAWYVAAWSDELQDVPLARTLLGEPVVLYRDVDGSPVALRDACPHRFAPLSLGKVSGGNIHCPYHGLVFDRTGACVHNPNGRGQTPKSLGVKRYPIKTGCGAIWLWFGDPEKAETVEPPTYPFLEDTAWHTCSGYVHVDANYELVADNLLDLTHAEYLHPFLTPPGGYNGVIYRAEQVEDRVTAFHSMPNSVMSGVFAPFFHPSVTHIDARGDMHWQAPSNLVIETGAKAVDGKTPDQEVTLMGTHLLTPETEDSTHYFWTAARTQQVDNAQLDEMLKVGITQTFQNEDEPMIRAVSQRMAGQALFDLSPALLPQDEAAVRARRILAKMIDAENLDRS